MTDQELIDLVKTKTAEELTTDEIQTLRRRISDSPELRDALRKQVELETYLAAALGRIDLSADDILQNSEKSKPTQGSVWSTLAGVLLCLLLFAYLGIGVYRGLYPDAWEAPRKVGQAKTKKKSLSDPSKETDKDPKTRSGSHDPSSKDKGSVDPPERDEPLEPLSLPATIQAETFVRQQNVGIDKQQWGTSEQPVVYSTNSPAFVEFEFALEEAEKLELRMRFASFDSRPLQMSLNGDVVSSAAGGEQTGGATINEQQWFNVGKFDFRKGKNILRFETSGKFPFFDQFVLAKPAAQVAVIPPMKPDDPPKPEPPKTPWQLVLEDPAEPPTFEDVCFREFDVANGLPSEKDLKEWFEVVPGQRSRIYSRKGEFGQQGAWEGVVRLKAPWQDDTALRFELQEYGALRLHFYHGDHGISLIYYRDEGDRWGGYVTTREPGKALPKTFALTATDEGRCRRSEIRHGGPIAVRCREDQLILSRGDVVLLRAPFEGMPEDVFFEGHYAMQGIELIRDREFPPREPQIPTSVEELRPADLTWEEHLSKNAELTKADDGSLLLRSHNTEAESWLFTPIQSRGIREVVLQVSDATPGAGICLGRKDGVIHEIVRFVRNKRDGSLALSVEPRNTTWEEDHKLPTERLVARAAPRQWIRLLYGCGMMRWWISTDGVHWAEPADRSFPTPGDVTSVGLICLAKRPDCQIRLHKIEERLLPQFNALANQDLWAKAPVITNLPHGPWLNRVSESIPPNVELRDWWRTCAVRALAAGCWRPLGLALLNQLLKDGADQRPFAEQLKLLDEATLLAAIGGDYNAVNTQFQLYHDTAIAAFRKDNISPWTSLRHHLMHLSISDIHHARIVNAETVRLELLQLLYEGRWSDTTDLCRKLKYFHQETNIPLLEWAEVTAQRQQPQQGQLTGAIRRRADWLHPLEEELSKQAYNVTAELKAMLDSEAYKDAARMITRIDPGSMHGVAPLAGDDGLLVSLPAAIRLSIQEHPDLEDVLVDSYGDLASLRVKQAIAAGDVDAVRLATVQFGSTEAAAEAHRWLGDRALSSGWFTRAVAEYERAEQRAGTLMRRELAPRIRLAAAMMGHDAGEPIDYTVTLGEYRMNANEFEQLITEMRERGESTTQTAAVADQWLTQSVPQPSGFESHNRARLDGPVGHDAGHEGLPHIRRYEVPWVDRQLATVRVGDELYVSNRFQIAAYDLNSGQRKWQSENPSGKQLRAQDWALTPMQPLVVGDRIFARLLYEKGPMLVCLDRSTGKQVWTAGQHHNLYLASDPVLIQGQLSCLAFEQHSSQPGILRLQILAAETGDVLQQHELIRLRSTWWDRRYCRVTPLDDGIVANLGGVTMCCNIDGSVRWLRKQVVLPMSEEPNWVKQSFDRPLLHEGRLYLAQAGVRMIECVAPATGKQHWRLLKTDVLGIVGVSNDRLIIRTEQGLESLDAEDGKSVWQCNIDQQQFP